jgi:NDP-sugar pyrophosphorylase family protein
MTVFKNEGRWDTSNVWFDGEKIVCYDKKQRTPQIQYIDYGLGVLRAEAMSRWPDNEAFDLADVYHGLAAEKQLAGYEVTQRFYEIGSPKGLAELDTLLRNQPAFCTP